MPGMGMTPAQTAAGGSGLTMGMTPAQTGAGAPGMMGGGAGYPGQQPPMTPYGNVMPGAGGMPGWGGYGGGQLGSNAPQGRTSGAVAGQAVTGLAFSPDGALAAQDFTRQQLVQSDEYAVETHFASLDVDLPQRGREYLFTTPRGDIEITARAVSEPLLGRLIRLLILAAGVVILIVLLRVLPRVLPVLHRSRWVAGAVLLLGLLSLLLGIFPILALAALIYGLVQLIRLEIARRRKGRLASAAS